MAGAATFAAAALAGADAVFTRLTAFCGAFLATFAAFLDTFFTLALFFAPPVLDDFEGAFFRVPEDFFFLTTDRCFEDFLTFSRSFFLERLSFFFCFAARSCRAGMVNVSSF